MRRSQLPVATPIVPRLLGFDSTDPQERGEAMEWARELDVQSDAVSRYEDSGELRHDAHGWLHECDDDDLLEAIDDWYRTTSMHCTAIEDIMTGDRSVS